MFLIFLKEFNPLDTFSIRDCDLDVVKYKFHIQILFNLIPKSYPFLLEFKNFEGERYTHFYATSWIKKREIFICSFETQPDSTSRLKTRPIRGWNRVGLKKIGKEKTRYDPTKPGKKLGCNPLTFFFTKTTSFWFFKKNNPGDRVTQSKTRTRVLNWNGSETMLLS